MSSPLRALAELEPRAWIVGGAVRDRLLGRATGDYDVASTADPRRLARELARSLDAHCFRLSEEFGAWRVVDRDHRWQVDVLPVAGDSIEDDLARRDFTVNAIAERVSGEERIDPFGGVRDVREGVLRMVSEQAFSEDPLRALRLVRLACELGFEIEPQTLQRARSEASGLRRVASERVFVELKRIIIADRALEGLSAMDAIGATPVILPEWSELRGVEQSSYHHLDVAEHTRAVLAETISLEREPERWFKENGEAVSRHLAQPLANELTRAQALRFGALFHDIAKPRTRAVTPEGRVTFIGHDATGAQLAAEVLGRLHASDRLIQYVGALARHHLRLGFLVHEVPLTRRAIYRYLRACEPVQVDVTLLSVADRLATRGRGSDAAIERHLELARRLLAEALAWREDPPRPPVSGHELRGELGIGPGPELGRLLAELEEASFAGEISTRSQAFEHARELLRGSATADR